MSRIPIGLACCGSSRPLWLTIALGAVVRGRPPPAEIPGVVQRQGAEKKVFTDSEIVDGFFKTAFGAEYHLAGRVDRIGKYDMAVRVFADGNRADRKAQLAKDPRPNRSERFSTRHRHGDQQRRLYVLVEIGALPATSTAPSRPFTAANAHREIRTSLDPQCLSGFRKNEKFEIEHFDVILTVDNGDFVFFDCGYEELLQSLGPINDTSTVPWTMFNDNVSMGYFDIYDQ